MFHRIRISNACFFFWARYFTDPLNPLSAPPLRFLLNPSACLDEHMLQFKFLGILMGVAIRTKKPLDLHLAPLVWKQLCCIPLLLEDLEEVDLLYVQTLKSILHIEDSGITEDNFHEVRTPETAGGDSASSRHNFLNIFPHLLLVYLYFSAKSQILTIVFTLDRIIYKLNRKVHQTIETSKILL